MARINDLAWPASQLGEAMNALARRSSLGADVAELPNPSRAAAHRPGAWIEAAAERLGLEAEEVGALYGAVERMILTSGPALLRLPGENMFLALLGHRGGKALALAPDLKVRRIAVGELRALICRKREEPLDGEVDEMLSQAGVSRRRLDAARAAMLRERLSGVWIDDCWLCWGWLANRASPAMEPAMDLAMELAPRRMSCWKPIN